MTKIIFPTKLQTKIICVFYNWPGNKKLKTHQIPKTTSISSQKRTINQKFPPHKICIFIQSIYQTVGGHKTFTWEVACSRSWTVIGDSDNTKSPEGNRANGFRPKSITTSINWWSSGCSLTLCRITSGKRAKRRPSSTSKSSSSGEEEHDELEEHKEPRKNLGYPEGILAGKWGKYRFGGDLREKEWVLHWNLGDKARIWSLGINRGWGGNRWTQLESICFGGKSGMHEVTACDQIVLFLFAWEFSPTVRRGREGERSVLKGGCANFLCFDSFLACTMGDYTDSHFSPTINCVQNKVTRTSLIYCILIWKIFFFLFFFGSSRSYPFFLC